jgi:hypothetical protein
MGGACIDGGWRLLPWGQPWVEPDIYYGRIVGGVVAVRARGSCYGNRGWW